MAYRRSASALRRVRDVLVGEGAKRVDDCRFVVGNDEVGETPAGGSLILNDLRVVVRAFDFLPFEDARPSLHPILEVVHVVVPFGEQSGDVLARPALGTENRYLLVLGNRFEQFVVRVVGEIFEVGDVYGLDVFAVDVPLLVLVRRSNVENRDLVPGVDSPVQFVGSHRFHFGVRRWKR